MIGPSVDFAFAACADDVARAILLVAKKRATAMDALLLVRLSRIKWRVRPLRVARHSAFVRQRLVVIRAIPIAAPFPNVSEIGRASCRERGESSEGAGGVSEEG